MKPTHSITVPNVVNDYSSAVSIDDCRDVSKTVYLVGADTDAIRIYLGAADGTWGPPIGLTGLQKSVIIPASSANVVRVQRASGTGSVICTLVGETEPGGVPGPEARPGWSLPYSITTGAVMPFDVTDTARVVAGGTFVVGPNGITADGTNYSTLTITAKDAAGSNLGTVCSWVFNSNKATLTRVAATLGSYLTIPAGATLCWSFVESGTGAVMNAGEFELL